MAPNERLAAIDELQKLIDRERLSILGSELRAEISCPHCGGKDIVKRGKDKLGKQMHWCKGCGKRFNNPGGNLLSRSKLEHDKWMIFAECFVDRRPLRKCAADCDVSLKTAWFMRHRVMEMIKKSMPAFEVRAEYGLQLDEAFLEESFKGNHKRSADFEMPGEVRKNGTKGH